MEDMEIKPQSKQVLYEFHGQNVTQTKEMDKYEPTLDYEIVGAAETLAELFGGETTVTVSYVYKVKAKSEK
jgi:hypothetical protein